MLCVHLMKRFSTVFKLKFDDNLLWGLLFPPCRPPSFLVRAGGGGGLIQKVASMKLKIWQQVALQYAQIAMRGFRARQNSYGFTAIWSQIFFKEKFASMRLEIGQQVA